MLRRSLCPPPSAGLFLVRVSSFARCPACCFVFIYERDLGGLPGRAAQATSATGRSCPPTSCAQNSEGQRLPHVARLSGAGQPFCYGFYPFVSDGKLGPPAAPPRCPGTTLLPPLLAAHLCCPPGGSSRTGEMMGGRRTWGGRRDLCLRETGRRLAAGWRVPSPRASSAPFGTQRSRFPASPSSSGPFPVLPRGSDGRDPFPSYVSRTTSRERRQTSALHSFQDELPGRAVTRRGALGVVPEPGLTHPRTGHVAVPEVTHMRKPRPGKGPGRPQGRHGRSRAGGAVKTHESSPE